MHFIITLISLIIERFFNWSHVRTWNWFFRYERGLRNSLGKFSPSLIFILSMIPILILVGFVDWLLSGWFYNVFKIIFGIAVLMYCFGPKNLWAEIYTSTNELHTDNVNDAVLKVQTAFNLNPASDSQTFHRAFTGCIFIAANQRIFAVIFWFTVLGPVGAVLYRMISLNAHYFPESPFAKKLEGILDWIPVRIFTFIFALGGHFRDVMRHCWKDGFKKGIEANDALLSGCGIAALDVVEGDKIPEDGSAEKEALALLDRVFVMVLVISAAVVLLT